MTNGPRDRKIAAARASLGSKCARCGSVDGLQFDHIDPSTKSYNITTGTRYPDFWTEVAKCQLLCVPCHKAKTSEDMAAMPACRRAGHPYPENRYFSPGGQARCRACNTEMIREARPKRVPAAEKPSCVHGHAWPEFLRVRANGTTCCTACERNAYLRRLGR